MIKNQSSHQAQENNKPKESGNEMRRRMKPKKRRYSEGYVYVNDHATDARLARLMNANPNGF